MTHFATRCQQRGLANVNPNDLWADLRKACADPDRYHEYVDHILTFPQDSQYSRAALFRFRATPECFHYAVIRDGLPVTVLTEAHARAYKRVRKRQRFERVG